MDDLHFLERLDRVQAHQADLAMALYRAPELVRYVLDRECAPDQPRIAISLGDPVLGPFVIVTRSGSFVTCLAAGMTTELPIITKARLDALRERHRDFNQRLMFVSDTDQRTMRAVWRTIYNRAHRVPREAMTIAAMIAPLMQAEVLQAHMAAVDRVRTALREAHRLVARRDRWSARDLELLERIWVDVWTMAHFTLLDYSGRGEDLAARHRIGLQTEGLPPLGFLEVAMSIPFAPVQVRCAWAYSRLGAMGVEVGRAVFDEVTPWYPNAGALLYMLSALAHAQPALHDEVVSLIRQPFDDDREGLDAMRKAMVPQLEHPDRAGLCRRVLCHHGRRISGMPRLVGAELAAEAQRPQALPLLQRGAVTLANAFNDAFETARHSHDAMALLPWLVRAEPDELYWTQPEIDRFEKPWSVEDTYRLLADFTECPSLLHAMKGATQAVAEKKPGRNDPCTCGSGKKYKKCCGGRA